ncbi:MAG: efflux RND transporter periplasmic adaptor subunit [Saprospiraceae bacterium]|nr:efflux RND transporter periplasmic adaptor subunit [Saprospiraceae bacterium]
MKNWKFILTILVTALVSLGAGYFIFGGSSAVDHTEHTSTDTASTEIWTCSMHPQIRQSEPGKCPICGMDLIPLSDASTSDNPLVMEMTQEAVKLANIQTKVVGSSQGGSKSILLTGKIQADERRVSSQVAHVPGRIEELFISFTGESIRRGQKLATIYSPELVSAQRELFEAQKMAASRPQLLEAARNKLRYWKIPEATIEQIEKSGQIQPNITVYADQSGIVLKRRVAVGDYIKEGTVLFDIANLNRLWVLFDAYEEDLAEIRLGDVVEYSVPALPGRIFSARISFIDPVINPQTRVASLRAEVVNTSGLLKPEMFIRGTIKTYSGGKKGMLAVPKTAVLWTGTRSVVYVEQPDAAVPSYEFREIEIGDALGDQYVVKSGLEPGERVVVNGAFVIDAAAQLNNMASMMNRNVQQTGMAASIPDHSGHTPVKFRAQLMDVVQAYMPLKDALIQTDLKTAKAATPALLAALGRVNMTLLDGEAHMYWMRKLEVLQAHSKGIAEATKIELQRKQFSFFTNALVEVLTAFGAGDSTLYLQHCPMAFDNEGADWLSRDKGIQNPYFGDKMLSCGTIKETFPIKPEPASSPANPNQFHHH